MPTCGAIFVSVLFNQKKKCRFNQVKCFVYKKKLSNIFFLFEAMFLILIFKVIISVVLMKFN